MNPWGIPLTNFWRCSKLTPEETFEEFPNKSPGGFPEGTLWWYSVGKFILNNYEGNPAEVLGGIQERSYGWNFINNAKRNSCSEKKPHWEHSGRILEVSGALQLSVLNPGRVFWENAKRNCLKNLEYLVKPRRKWNPWNWNSRRPLKQSQVS